MTTIHFQCQKLLKNCKCQSHLMFLQGDRVRFALLSNWSYPEVKQKFSEFNEFRESDKSLKHELGSIKDPVSYMCLAGAVVASWSLTQEVAGLINIFVTEFAEFSETFRKNSIGWAELHRIVCSVWSIQTKNRLEKHTQQHFQRRYATTELKW